MLCHHLSLVVRVLLPLTVIGSAAAAEPFCPSPRVQVAGNFENDMFGQTDRYYTNGFSLAAVKVTEATPGSEWWRRQLRFHADEIARSGRGWEFGQLMFTPQDIKRANPDQIDQPYAGWLFAGIHRQIEGRDRLDIVGFKVGMIGPASLAHQTQDAVHRWRGIPRAQGWSHQLRDEPGLVLSYEQRRRIALLTGDWSADAIPFAGVNLGNVLTSAQAGLQLRCGWHVPADYGTSFLRQVGTVPTLCGAPATWGAHGFAVAGGAAVARNIFLDGNTFHSSPSVAKEPWFAAWGGGLGLTAPRCKITFTYVWMTSEFKAQHGVQLFGSITVETAF
jgi:lipid A 3-O-deacylase